MLSFKKKLKIQDISFVVPLMLRPLMHAKNMALAQKTAPGTTILAEPYFASKSIEHDVTLTSFPADLC